MLEIAPPVTVMQHPSSHICTDIKNQKQKSLLVPEKHLSGCRLFRKLRVPPSCLNRWHTHTHTQPLSVWSAVWNLAQVAAELISMPAVTLVWVESSLMLHLGKSISNIIMLQMSSFTATVFILTGEIHIFKFYLQHPHTLCCVSFKVKCNIFCLIFSTIKCVIRWRWHIRKQNGIAFIFAVVWLSGIKTPSN